jgi:hypothetical protein
MTTLLSWVAYSDTGEFSHLPRAAYLVSDSRITWGSAARRWEAGRKVFAPTTIPHLFGFSGDVVFPALVLGQIVSAMDASVLFLPGDGAEEQHQAVLSAIKRGLARATKTPTTDFVIHHVLRENSWPETRFRAWAVRYTSQTGVCASEEMPIPSATGVIGSFGSGRISAGQHRARWEGSDSGGRSRAILAAFCDSISSADDPLSGGPPQLAALYTKGTPVQIGMIVEGRRFMNGMELEPSKALARAEWRDALGQQVDPLTGKAKQGVRRFIRPKTLTKP